MALQFAYLEYLGESSRLKNFQNWQFNLITNKLRAVFEYIFNVGLLYSLINIIILALRTNGQKCKFSI